MIDQELDATDPWRHGRFDGQIAVITGGTQGLGRATAELMIARGASGIVIVGRDRNKGQAAATELGTPDCPVEFVGADLATVDGCEAAISAVDDRFGAVHAFVNCAAATGRGTVWNSTAAMWDHMLATNLRMPGLLTTGFAKIMKREDIAGSMVMIGSMVHHGGMPVLWPYAAAKHGLEALVRNAAYSLMPEGIRVNLLNPGWMDTPAEHDTQRFYHDAPDDWLETAEAAQPFGRLLKPQEVARGICFLASSESGMMTGASIDFDQTIVGAGDLPRAEPVPEWFSWQDR